MLLWHPSETIAEYEITVGVLKCLLKWEKQPAWGEEQSKIFPWNRWFLKSGQHSRVLNKGMDFRQSFDLQTTVARRKKNCLISGLPKKTGNWHQDRGVKLEQWPSTFGEGAGELRKKPTPLPHSAVMWGLLKDEGRTGKPSHSVLRSQVLLKGSF